ncbi:MAG: [FeFe] hydrogenase H-cluster radical SAM maturase HydE [Bacteroidales bacterium]|jgi:biotin synthase|nr:[FeFe] hydrogenase H-cluster radical SAM maturase HydE [Bacteroidales bacterium]
MSKIAEILKKETFTQSDIISLLESEGDDKQLLFKESAKIKKEQVENIVYYRGLIEFSNICDKNCEYCGIRADNSNVQRYNLTNEEIIKAADFAYKNCYASIVLQAGELANKVFINRVTTLIEKIKKSTNNEIGITLSLGEQTEETYQRWFNSGAHRYLLRIETTNSNLYKEIHPNNIRHNFETRLQCLELLKKIGYQVGSGVMVGLPFQTYSDLANDLLFMKIFDIDMCGMGPYIEHSETPLYQFRHLLEPKEKRFELTLKMIAILRIMMKDINIAASTALQAIDPMGREKAIKIGANIIMPNITPGKYRNNYKLYENKPCTNEDAEECNSCLEMRISLTDNEIGDGKWGDSLHFIKKNLQT